MLLVSVYVPLVTSKTLIVIIPVAPCRPPGSSASALPPASAVVLQSASTAPPGPVNWNTIVSPGLNAPSPAANAETLPLAFVFIMASALLLSVYLPEDIGFAEHTVIRDSLVMLTAVVFLAIVVFLAMVVFLVILGLVTLSEVLFLVILSLVTLSEVLFLVILSLVTLSAIVLPAGDLSVRFAVIVFSGTVAVDCTVVAGAGVVVFDGVVGRRAVVWLPVFADAFSVAFATVRPELAVEAESEVAFVADADLSFVSLMSVLLPALV